MTNKTEKKTDEITNKNKIDKCNIFLFRISSQPKMISQPSVCKMGLKKTLSVQVVSTLTHSCSFLDSVKMESVKVQVQVVSVQSSKNFSFCLKLLLLLDFSLFSSALRGEMHAKPLFREMALFLNKHLASLLPCCFSTLISSSLGDFLPWFSPPTSLSKLVKFNLINNSF